MDLSTFLRPGAGEPTREIPLQKGRAALLVVDMQNYAMPGHGIFKDFDPDNADDKHRYMFDRLQSTTIPAIQALLKSCRPKMEVIYTFVECLTRDGRDQSLDYKLSGFCVPRGSPDAKVIPELAPEEDDILIPKTSCSVFNSTNIEYVLRNLGIAQLVVTGILTNQCVESAVRDAADRGFFVTLVEDACATNSQEDHDQSLKNMRGFARIVSHSVVEKEVASW